MPTPRIVASSDERRSQKRRWFFALSGNALLVTLLVHFLFGVAAVYLVVEHYQKKPRINFQPSGPPPEHNEIQHKVELAKKSDSESAPPDLKRITTTGLSPITLPDVPDVPMPDEVSPTAMSGVDGLLGSGLGEGDGNGTGNGNGSGMPEFGTTDGPGLTGYFYDLKQTPDKKPTGMKLSNYYQALKKYLDEHWDESILDAYFKSKKPLYTTRFSISTRSSAEAPAAFHLQNEVKPALWAIHYQGKVQAPEGNYRFVGFADNVIIVRINGVVVFDGGWTPLVTSADLRQNFPFQWSALYSSEGAKAPRGLLKGGITFHMDPSEASDMDVLIGDDGGKCAFYLMVMNVDHTYDKLPDGTPKAPFFQLDTGNAPKFQEAEEHPPYSPSPEPWQNVQSVADP